MIPFAPCMIAAKLVAKSCDRLGKWCHFPHPLNHCRIGQQARTFPLPKRFMSLLICFISLIVSATQVISLGWPSFSRTGYISGMKTSVAVTNLAYRDTCQNGLSTSAWQVSRMGSIAVTLSCRSRTFCGVSCSDVSSPRYHASTFFR